MVSRRPAGRRPAVVVSRRLASSSSSSGSRRLLSSSRRLLSAEKPSISPSHVFVFLVRLIFLKTVLICFRFFIAYGELTLTIVLKL